MPRKTHPHQDLDLEDLVAHIHRVNPTGRSLRRSEEGARYAEKARLQSLLLETYPHDVRVCVHHDMPGIVSLSVPRLQASAGHAVVEALSTAARHWIEIRSKPEDDAVPSSHEGGRRSQKSAVTSFIERAGRLLAEYDFDCAIQTLTDGAHDPLINHDERIRALLLLLEIHVDHLANHDAALQIEAALRPLDGLSERAHELLGIAASRTGDTTRALNHLGKCRGERVGAEIAVIARTNVQARDWAHARKAWMHLSMLAATMEPPLATSLAVLRDDVRDLFVREAMGKQDDDIEADPELERFVREFAPRHPWILAHRAHKQKARLESSARNTLRKAREAKAAGLLDELSLVLEAIPGDGLSAADAAELAALRGWAEERRTLAQVTRAVSLARSDDLDAACHAYVALSPRARDLVQEQHAEVLFHAIDQLNEVFPARANGRALLRAAVVWTQAQRSPNPFAAWSLVAPHTGLLEAVPAFVAYLSDLRAQSEASRALGTTGPSRGVSPTPDECVEGVCFSEWNEEGSVYVRPIRIARQSLRIGPESFVLTLGRVTEDGDWIVSAWPCRSSGLPRHVRIRHMHHGRPWRIVAQKHRAVLLDELGALWVVDFGAHLLVRRINPFLPAPMSDDVAFVVIDDEHCAIKPKMHRDEPESWWVVHVPSGLVRTELRGRGLHCVRSIRGATFYRVLGLCLERLDTAGQVVDHFELPKNVSPWALVELPDTSRPIVIAPAVVQSCVLAWWQPQPRFFRSFELFDIDEHGHFVEAWWLAGRGMFVMTQRKDGRVFVHEATMGKNVLRPSHSWEVSLESRTLVHEPMGRRTWVVRSSSEMPMGLGTTSAEGDPNLQMCKLEIDDFMHWVERSWSCVESQGGCGQPRRDKLLGVV